LFAWFTDDVVDGALDPWSCYTRQASLAVANSGGLKRFILFVSCLFEWRHSPFPMQKNYISAEVP